MFYDGKLHLFMKRIDLVAVLCSLYAFSNNSMVYKEGVITLIS